MTAVEFASLTERDGRRLFTIAFRICGNREDAEDVVQEALGRAWKASGEFRGESEPSTWIHRIVVNKAVGRELVRTIRDAGMHPEGTCSCERRYGVAFALKPDLLRIAREAAATGLDAGEPDTRTGRYPSVDPLYRSVRAVDFDPARLRIKA